jgi:hypothetical protein
VHSSSLTWRNSAETTSADRRHHARPLVFIVFDNSIMQRPII